MTEAMPAAEFDLSAVLALTATCSLGGGRKQMYAASLTASEHHR